MEKKLYKVREGKMLDGVCGGIAEYFNIDPQLFGWPDTVLRCWRKRHFGVHDLRHRYSAAAGLRGRRWFGVKK